MSSNMVFFNNAQQLPDPYFQNVVMLLQMEGSENSQAFTDKSKYGFPVLAKGGAKITNINTAPNFGGECVLGDDNWLDLGKQSVFDFGAGDWTVELFIKNTDFTKNGSPASNQCILDTRSQANTNESNRFVMSTNETGYPVIVDATNDTTYTSSIGLTANTRQHVAFCKNNNKIEIWVGGQLGGSWANTTSWTVGTKLALGALVGNAGVYVRGFRHGTIDEFRLTSGVARYKASFIPPQQSFPTA